MSKVYLVMGTTGKYEDYQEWVAAVCGSQRTATARTSKLNAITEGHGRDTYYNQDRLATLLSRLQKAGDQSPKFDNTGTEYYIDGPFEVETKA